ncbi:MAG: 4-(cytidine 5'-diphospho)-2-C-methyl-D-erythritol kinase [Candidatus Hydrogenedentes bacterium]|jgi:4-diphosphocytidyl-2-C-methyl-D-erythritol kinase|nr:4-(cytidine 5'-diphospho)-2-C-methyl-D-erythritol kinase [Candidatus Hydrogenedentota bacterium]
MISCAQSEVKQHVWRSYAKINLYLDVLKKRRDGFHNIETIFQSVSLFDELTFRAATTLTLSCNLAHLNCGPSNLVHRAALLLQEKTGCQKGASIYLEKNIPIGAGLAGGSGNAAATLQALNSLWDLKLCTTQLERFARNLGADVPYCLHGGTRAGVLRGEELYPLPPLPELWFLFIHPKQSVSAKEVYNHPMLAPTGEKPFAGKTAAFREAIRSLQQSQYEGVLFNRMERPVFSCYPQLMDMKLALIKAGCKAALMSGSGPTLLGLCESQEQGILISENLKNTAPDWSISIASTVPYGTKRIA